jgi:hypothetical protein
MVLIMFPPFVVLAFLGPGNNFSMTLACEPTLFLGLLPGGRWIEMKQDEARCFSLTADVRLLAGGHALNLPLAGGWPSIRIYP